jgi:hypothetical protein
MWVQAGPVNYTRQGTPVFRDFFANPAGGVFVSDEQMLVNAIRGIPPPDGMEHFHIHGGGFSTGIVINGDPRGSITGQRPKPPVPPQI